MMINPSLRMTPLCQEHPKLVQAQEEIKLKNKIPFDWKGTPVALELCEGSPEPTFISIHFYKHGPHFALLAPFPMCPYRPDVPTPELAQQSWFETKFFWVPDLSLISHNDPQMGTLETQVLTT